MKQFAAVAILALTACSGEGIGAGPDPSYGGSNTSEVGGSSSAGAQQTGGSVAAGSGGAAGGASGGASSAGTSAIAGSGGNETAGVAGSNGGLAGPRFIGRFTADHRFAWSGSAIELSFTGTEISVTLEDTAGHNWYEVVLDGQRSSFQAQQGQHTYMLGSGLAPGTHKVVVYKRTEAFFNASRFVSFSVPESAWQPVAAPDRRLEVIGDSISAGYGVDGLGPDCPFVPETENHFNTYGAIAARAVGADLHTQAWSGAGMYRSVDGTTDHLLPVYSLRTVPTEPNTEWDYSKYQPHAVIVNLGTNDFALGDPGAAFGSAYAAFFEQLRTRYPSARFYAAIGTMLGTSEYDKVKAYITAAIQTRASAGDTNVALLELGIQNAQTDGLGCGWHPSAKTHELMAAKVEAALRADLGW